MQEDDIFEILADRVLGTFSVRMFRDYVWRDWGVAFQEEVFKTGNLYFALSLKELAYVV